MFEEPLRQAAARRREVIGTGPQQTRSPRQLRPRAVRQLVRWLVTRLAA